ncbi:MAG: helix-turn-helix domain-containing protein [Candidatus Thermoplasmatota archaeon]|nr:helix-turn-helix domain-containing protein [Candidatus Thermoplasmatota archaeon]
MAFQIHVVSNVPLTSVKDPQEVALLFLGQIGYLPKRAGVGDEEVRRSIPYRLLVDHLLRRPERGWTAEELASRLGTGKATVYRHINKLKSLDLLEEVEVPTPDGSRKGYRIRYGNLAKAWNFVEAHVDVAMENYRRTVEHLQGLIEGGSLHGEG